MERKIKQLLREFEGTSKRVYKDSLGYKTVGVGHKVQPKEGYRLGQVLSMETVNELFERDIEEALNLGVNIFPQFHTYREDVRVFIVLMCFNMGKRLTRFKKANGYLKIGNMYKARFEYLNSKWFHQVHLHRALKTTDLLIGGLHDIL